MQDDTEGAVRLNPDAEALLGFTAAVDSFTNSMMKFGHLLQQKDLDADFLAEVQATADAVMKRFRNEVEQGMSVVVGPGKRAFLLPPPETMQ